MEGHAADWERAAARQPAVLRALGAQYLAAHRMAEAERCLKAAVKVSPSAQNYRALADVYRHQNQMDQWVATLEGVLEQPDYALDHARVKAEIADYFMGRGKLDKALPYALGAAQCYSDWGLRCGARCCEGLGRWGAAEKLWRACSERYRGEESVWYFFCKRTGRGDVASAHDLMAQAVQRRVCSSLDVAMYHRLEKRPEQALMIVKGDFVRGYDPYVGLFVAMWSDQLKETQQRDDALKQIAEKGHGVLLQATGKPREELIALAALMAKDLSEGGKGQIDLAAAKRLWSTAEAGEQASFDYFLAGYLDLHGNREAAVQLWRECMASRQFEDYTCTFAGAALVEHRIRVEEHKP